MTVKNNKIITLNDFLPWIPSVRELNWEEQSEIEVNIKYETYIERQIEEVRKLKKEEAKKHYLEAVRLKPDYGEGICNLALVYLQNGDREAAYSQLKTLEKVDVKLAAQLRDVMWSKYVVNASKVRTKN